MQTRTHRSPVVRFREDLGWDQRRLSLESGVGQASLSRFETGRGGVSGENLLKISKALGRQPWELLDRPELAS